MRDLTRSAQKDEEIEYISNCKELRKEGAKSPTREDTSNSVLKTT
jgi:hypothetical protein